MFGVKFNDQYFKIKDVYKRQTPYTAMYEKQPPREIQELIKFPKSPPYQFNKLKFYNQMMENLEKRRNKYQKIKGKIIKYEVGEKVLLKNRELPSTLEGISKKLLLLYVGTYTITKNNNNNAYELTDPISKKIKGNCNQQSMKKYHEEGKVK